MTMNDERQTDSVAEQEAAPPRAGVDAALTPWGFPRLQTCPECEYSLAGLPAPHRCPECGFEYDEFACEWENRSYRSQWLGGLASILVLLGFLWYARGSGISALSLFAGFCLLVTSLSVLVLWRLSKRRCFVALTPDGIRVRNPTGDSGLIPWEGVRLATGFAWGISWGPRLLYPGSLSLWHSARLGACLQSATQIEQFARAIEEGRTHYSKAVGEQKPRRPSHDKLPRSGEGM